MQHLPSNLHVFRGPEALKISILIKKMSASDDSPRHFKHTLKTNHQKHPIQAIWALTSANDSPSSSTRLFDTPSSPKPHKKSVFDDLQKKDKKIVLFAMAPQAPIFF